MTGSIDVKVTAAGRRQIACIHRQSAADIQRAVATGIKPFGNAEVNLLEAVNAEIAAALAIIFSRNLQRALTACLLRRNHAQAVVQLQGVRLQFCRLSRRSET